MGTQDWAGTDISAVSHVDMLAVLRGWNERKDMLRESEHHALSSARITIMDVQEQNGWKL
jgi:hypothetical protein